MGKVIVQHVDEATWVRGGPPGSGAPEVGGGQLIGDLEKGPWIHINWLPPGTVAAPHSHSHDEVMFILEGSFLFGDRECGPGTALYIEKGTSYGFTVGPTGVRFMNIRQGLASITVGGKTSNPYAQKPGEAPAA